MPDPDAFADAVAAKLAARGFEFDLSVEELPPVGLRLEIEDPRGDGVPIDLIIESDNAVLTLGQSVAVEMELRLSTVVGILDGAMSSHLRELRRGRFAEIISDENGAPIRFWNNRPMLPWSRGAEVVAIYSPYPRRKENG